MDTISRCSLSSLPLERLEAVIWEGSADLTSAEHDWLLAVAEFDHRRGWERWEAQSCAHWLSWQVGLDMRAAREKVRVAHALARFPLISAEMASGRLSYSKVRAITRIATVSNEAELVQLALAGTTNQVERIVSAWRRTSPDPEARERRQRSRRGLWHETQPDGTVTITLRLPAEAAAVVLSAVEECTPPAEVLPDGTREPLAVRRADGAVAVATAAHALMERVASQPGYLVTLHADVDALRGGDGMLHVEALGDALGVPVAVSAATAERVMCDADVEVMFEREGRPVGMSARSSIITGRLRRLVLARDRCCQFPGCGRRAGVEVHHLRPRSQGGANSLDNLVTLCRFHHHRLHEGGWTVHRTDGQLVFTAPDGRSFTTSPPPRRGRAGRVWAHGRSADDGRSQWCGDTLDLQHVLSAHHHHQRDNSPGSAPPHRRTA